MDCRNRRDAGAVEGGGGESTGKAKATEGGVRSWREQEGEKPLRLDLFEVFSDRPDLDQPPKLVRGALQTLSKTIFLSEPVQGRFFSNNCEMLQCEKTFILLESGGK